MSYAKQIEKNEFGRLYHYVRQQVMGYTNKPLTKTMVLRLQGLKNNQYVKNKNTNDSADYSYKLILATFKYCSKDIEKALKTKKFQGEIHKFNYILAIVESNLNTVYNQIRSKENDKETFKNADFSNLSYEGAEYQTKTNGVNDRLKNLW